MLKRTLCILLLLCLTLQSIPLSVFAEMLDGSQNEEVTSDIVPEAFEIKGVNIQNKSVEVLSPEERSAVVIVTQYKSGKAVSVNTVETELIVGLNTIYVPNYERDDTATTKVMLWDSMEKLRPLCEHLEINADELEVQFDTGNVGLTVSKRVYPADTSFGKLPTLVADDIWFVGWYYDKDFTKPVSEDDIVVESCTLYAKTVPYGEANTMFVERYVANTKAVAGTQILIISDDSTISADEVRKGIVAENLSVFDKQENYVLDQYSVEDYLKTNDPENSICEIGQQYWLENADAGTKLFVFYAQEGFAEGNSYRITLNDGRLSFAGHAVTARDYNLSVDKEYMSNLRLRDDIIFVNEELVNDVTDESEAQLFGDSSSGSSGKVNNRFSLGDGENLTLSKMVGGKLEIVSDSKVTGDFTINKTPEVLSDKTIAVYGFNDSGESASLFSGENLSLPEELTLDAATLWDLDYRTIEGQVGGEYIYTEADNKSILFKPDVFPMLEKDVKETVVEEKNGGEIKKTLININKDKTVTNPVTNETITYESLGITDETTVDVGDFIVFINYENENPVSQYVKITEAVEDKNDNYIVEYETVTEEDIISSMDMYGERGLSAKELTGLDDFTEIEEQAKLQAIESGFADNAAMYVSSVMIASEAFADLSKEFELNCEEIRDELTEASEAFSEGTLLAEDGSLFSSRGGVVTIEKPTVTPEIIPQFDVGGNNFGAGITLKLTIPGNIFVKIGENPQSTLTISYSIVFTQALRAEMVMTAKASYKRIFGFIPIINDCTINSNIDFYTSTDVNLGITVGLTSDGYDDKDENENENEDDNKDDPEEQVFVTPYGECYHRYSCFYLDKSKANNTLVSCTLSVAKESEEYRPCSRCCPGELFTENLDEEIKGIVDMVESIRDTVTDAVNTAQDFEAKVNEMRNQLGNSEPQQADDAGAAAEEDSLPATLVAEHALIEKYQALLSNSYSEWAEIYRLNLFNANVFTFFGIINVHVGMDFCLYANLNLALDANVHHENSRRFILTVSVFDGEVKQDTFELKPQVVSFGFTAMGTAGIKAGIEIAVGINLICKNLAQVSVTGEVGLYIKMWGYFKYSYTNIRSNVTSETTNSCHGALYFEMGPYVDIGFSASVFGTYGWYPTLFYKEFPLVTMGERKAVFGFADLDNNTEYQLRRDYDTLKLPADLLDVTYMDLRTGESGTISYADELKNENASNAALTGYTSKHYTLTIINDDNDNAFTFNPKTASIKVKTDDVDPGDEKPDPEETAELIITYIMPEFAFNSTAITKKIKLKWDTYGEEHTLAFDSNGGDYIAPIIENSKKTIELPMPERQGYDFAGWFDVDSGEEFNSTEMPEKDMQLRAKWTPAKTTYTVNHWQYDLNDVPQLYETEELEAITEDEVTPERKSYDGFRDHYRITEKVKGDGSTVIDYYYERESYLYELVVQDRKTRRMVRYGTPIVLSDREVPGYEFNGWFDNDGKSICKLLGRDETTGTLAFNYEFDQDLTLNANLTALDTTLYTIDFYKYEKHDYTTSDGETTISHYERLATLECQGETDTEVDLNKIEKEKPDALDLVKIYEANKDNGKFYVTSGYTLEEWKADLELAPDLAIGTIKGDGSLVLRVYCQKAKNKITYEGAKFEESNGDSKLVEINKPIPLPEINPEMIGKTFGGWKYKNKDGNLAYIAKYIVSTDSTGSAVSEWIFSDKEGNVVSEILMPKDGYTTEAIWNNNEYIIKLYDDNDNLVYSTKATYGMALPVLPDICIPDNREGWDFKGYRDENKFYYKYYEDGTESPTLRGEHEYDCANDLELKAEWVRKEGVVSFDGNGADSISLFEKNITSGQPYGELPTAERKGYNFVAWFTEEVGGVEINKDTIVETTDSHTLYAHWTPAEYKAEWNEAKNVKIEVVRTKTYVDGTPTGTLVSPAVVYCDDELEVTYTADKGYSLASSGKTEITVKGHITSETIYATAIPNTYTIEYDVVTSKPKNASGVIAPIAKDEVTYSNSITLQTPALKGWTFVGWFKDPSGIGSVNENNIKNVLSELNNNDTLKLYAKWDANTYTIELDPGYATNAETSNILGTYTYDDNGELKFDNSYTLERTGWTFDHWETKLKIGDNNPNNGSQVTTEGITNSDIKNLIDDNGLADITNVKITLKAHWNPNAYTVTFDKMGAGLLKNAEVSGEYDGNNLNIKYDAKEMKYTLTNETNSDPYATIGQEVYLEAGKTYYAYMETTGSVQMFYAIGGAYTETNSMRFYSGQKDAEEFTVPESGTYRIRFDNDAEKTITIKNFWISDVNSTTHKDNVYDSQMKLITVPKHKKCITFEGYYLGDKQYYNSQGAGINNNGVEVVYDIADNVTMTAKWSYEGHTAKWNVPEHASIKVKRTYSINPSVTYPGTIENGKTPVYCGDVLEITYEVDTGYSIASQGKTSITVMGDVTSNDVYVTPSANKYTVVYNGNGATSGSTSNSTHTYNESKALTSNGFTRTNHTFLGWSTDKNAITPTYTNGASVKNLIATKNGTVTLYAVWVKTTEEIGYYSREIHMPKDGSFNDVFYPGMNREALKSNGYNALKLEIEAHGKETNWICYNGMELNVMSYRDKLVFNKDFGSLSTHIFADDWQVKNITTTISLDDVQTDGSFWFHWTTSDHGGSNSDGWNLGTVVVKITAIK